MRSLVQVLRTRPRRERDVPRDAGLTLVELLVAMVVSGILATVIATVTLQAFRVQRQTLLREKDSTTASLAMETLSRDVRQALATQVVVGNAVTTVNAFSTTTPTSLSLVTWSKADPVLVTYTLSNGTLTRRVKAPDVPGQGTSSTFAGSGPTVTTTVASNVTNAGLFTYVRSDGTSATTYTTAADQALISAVTVTLTVDSDNGSLPGTTIQNTVDCQNL